MTRPFETLALPAEPTLLAPDGSEVRVLCSLEGGSMAHFRLAPGQVSAAVTHRSVEEIWYVVSGLGQMWRSASQQQALITLRPGICLTIPQGTRFQFRAAAHRPLEAVAITMPPWPGADEAEFVPGLWTADALPDVALVPATAADVEPLADLRVQAMRESLERVGRFDPERARARLRDGFAADRTWHIEHLDERVGFVVLSPGDDALRLDHLYLRPGAQGGRLGATVLAWVFGRADAAGLAVRVGALRDSDANRFYQRHGFREVERSEFDVYYLRPPRTATG